MSTAAAAAAISLPPRVARVSLYRDLLRTASRFHDYNFRMYAQRQVKEKVRGRGETRNCDASGIDANAICNCPLAAAAAPLPIGGRWSGTGEPMRMRSGM